MAPTELKEAVERVWARGWKPPGEAFGTKEFHGLVRACARLYPGMTPGKTYNPYQEAVENIFLNTPSRFYRKVEQRPQEAAEVIHQAFTQTKWPVTYLVPLDGCPSFPSVVRFGECEVGEFSREEFGTRIGESRWLARSTMEHSEREADRKAEEIGREIGRLSQFQWLVVTGLRSFERLEDRILGGGFGKVGDYFTFGTRTNWNEVDLVLAHSHKYEFCVEQALFCLAMCAWDEIVRITSIHEGWEPFSVPWICEVSDDPLVKGTSLPSANSFAWRHELHGDAESGQEWESENPAQVYYDADRMMAIEGNLSKVWTSVAAVWPSHAGFNRLVPHFVLQALEAEGIDQLIFHNTAVDAVLFAQGAKSGTQHFIEKLVDAESAVEYERLYDARSEYIHGRELKIPLTYDDLRKMRRLTRRVIVGVLELLQSHPSWTKREFIKHLHSL